ncbi:MAG: hypothetical protein LV480_10910 [Methylacidiphilales bacterium]|nr:hypothetical protein [Candidatus Methylacidiphilales bacterium]
MKLSLYVAGQVILWTLIGAVLLFLLFDWSKLTWFQLLFSLVFVAGAGNYFYFLLQCITYGREIDRRLVPLTLPESKIISFSTHGYWSAKFVLFSHNANLIALKGDISLKDAKGRIIERLLLNQLQAAMDVGQTVKSFRINEGGKAARTDYLRYLTFRQIGRDNEIAQLDFNLDWYPSKTIFAAKTKSGPIFFEIIVRARKLLPNYQASPVMQS